MAAVVSDGDESEATTIGVCLAFYDGETYVCLTEDGEPITLLSREAASKLASGLQEAAVELGRRTLS